MVEEYRLQGPLLAQSNLSAMKIIFTWSQTPEGYFPVSKSDFLNQDGISLLDCVLMDNGGLPYAESLPWLNAGVKKIKSVTMGTLKTSDWNREAWGVEFRNNTAKIHSLHDVGYFQTMSLEGFLRVLQEWIAFLQSQSAERETEILNLSIDG